jgi:hypothetical protein
VKRPLIATGSAVAGHRRPVRRPDGARIDHPARAGRGYDRRRRCERGTQSGATLNFSLQISRVIKGNPNLAGSSVPASWQAGGQLPAGGGSGVGGNGIWFLQQTASAWRVMPVTQGTVAFASIYLPAPPGPILGAYSYYVSFWKNWWAQYGTTLGN